MTTTPVLLTTHTGLVERPVRPWHRWVLKLFSDGLDRRIAAGEPTDRDRLIAARAQDLIGRRYRSELARWWQNAMLAGDANRRLSRHAVPVSRAQVRPAMPEIDELVGILQSGRPVSARGSAMATLLLTDGAGPVFLRTTPTLGAVLRDVIDAFDPLTELTSLAA